MVENDKRVRIVCGHYGSGKTEFAVNYAVKLAESGINPILADIDVINPYFRSRERTVELEERGIKVAASATEATMLDLPALSAGINAVFDDHSRPAVVDVGGNEAGVKVLNRFSDHFTDRDELDLFFIINANRPETADSGRILDFIRSFENACGLSVSGLINNTHMLKSTTVDDILGGYELASEVAEISGIPLRYNSGIAGLSEKLPERIRSSFFPMELFMRDEWMS